jgi:carbon-monoxide dehydrogenase medium subunit
VSLAHEFAYERPKTVDEVLLLKQQFGSKAFVLAGGTDLIVNIKEGMLKPELLIDIKEVAELKKLSYNGEVLFLSANVSFDELIESSEVKSNYPLLHDACRTVASHGVRTRATVIGNICSAVPSLDSAPALLCHYAIVHCASFEAKRNIPIREWFLAPRKTALQDIEIVTGISIPKVPESAGIYVKLGRYGGEDLAQAGWGIMLSRDLQYRIAHCALGPVPKRASMIEALLKGKELSEELIAEAVKLIPKEISPITDIRSSKEYRIHISGVMLKRGLLAARDRLNGKAVEAAKLLGGLA